MTRDQMIGACRDLLRGCRSGSLSTAMAVSDGWPYASLVTYATDIDGCPLFLLSTLADHTRNIAADPRAAAKALAAIEDSVIDHMNGDHAEALDLIANRLLGRRGSGWKMGGLDPDGVDLVLDGRWARVGFRASVGSAEEVRGELVRLTKAARGNP